MSKPKKNNDRLKLALVPVLGLVLFSVLPGESEVQSAAGQIALTGPAKTSSGKTSSDRRAVEWPRYSLKSVVAHNPFELSDPRVALDRAMFENGITSPEEMTEVSVLDFMEKYPAALPQSSISALDDENEFWAELMADFTTAASETADDGNVDDKLEDNNQQQADDDQQSKIEDEASLAESLQKEQDDRLAAEMLRRRQRLSQIQLQPITMFIESRDGNSVLVAGRTVVEGDEIEAGIRVDKIDRSGVTYEVVEITHPEELLPK